MWRNVHARELRWMSSNENQNYNLSFQHLKGGSFEGSSVYDLKGQMNSLKIQVVKSCWNGCEIFCLWWIYPCGKIGSFDDNDDYDDDDYEDDDDEEDGDDEDDDEDEDEDEDDGDNHD